MIAADLIAPIFFIGIAIGVIITVGLTHDKAKKEGAEEDINEWERQLKEKLLYYKVTQLYPDYKPDTITNDEFTKLLFHYLLIKGHIQITKVGDQKRYTFRYYTYAQHEQTT